MTDTRADFVGFYVLAPGHQLCPHLSPSPLSVCQRRHNHPPLVRTLRLMG
jgi:hypothetical protein